MKKKFLYAIATLIGMTVGAGIFSLPYTALRAGFFPVIFYLLLLASVLFLIYLLYGEIILITGSKYRLVGYSQIYLGKPGQAIATFSAIFGFYGVLLIYLIIGGRFLNLVLNPFFGGSEFLWTLVFFAVNALAIFFGLRVVASIEFFMSGFLFLVIFLFLIFGCPKINWAHFIDYSFVWPQIFYPYGIVLFALLGTVAIPELCQILGEAKHLIKKAIFWGTFIPVLIYVLFVITIFGISGIGTSKEAIEGLVPYFGQPIILIGAIFGLLAISTSFLVLGTNLKKVFQYDYKIGHGFSWALSCFVPLILYLSGFKNFIFIIGLVGAVMGGIDAILIILIYKKAKSLGKVAPGYKLKVPNLALAFLGLIFVLGIIYQIFQLFD